MDFLVAKDDLHSCRFIDAPPPVPRDGEALLAVDAFGLTANNITYAMFGDAMSYWNFPAEERLGPDARVGLRRGDRERPRGGRGRRPRIWIPAPLHRARSSRPPA